MAEPQTPYSGDEKALEVAAGVPDTPVRCKDCDLPNGCPEYCRCDPKPALGVDTSRGGAQ